MAGRRVLGEAPVALRAGFVAGPGETRLCLCGRPARILSNRQGVSIRDAMMAALSGYGHEAVALEDWLRVAEADLIERGGLVLDLRSKVASPGKGSVDLTRNEFLLLHTLMRRTGEVVTVPPQLSFKEAF